MTAGDRTYPLKVSNKRFETEDAASFVLIPRSTDAHAFSYRAGQFLTFSIPHEGKNLTRSYSLSSAPGVDAEMTICVKRVVGGRGSNWMIDQLETGDIIEATAPSGQFTLTDAQTPVLCVAGGSGITPCISMIKEALVKTERQVRLFYANRTAASVIYRDQLNSLATQFPDQFTCIHWLDEAKGFAAKADLLEALGPEVPDCYICGPTPLMDMAEALYLDQLCADATVKTERFVSPDDPVEVEQPSVKPAKGPASFTMTLDDEVHEIPLAPGQTLLEAALAQGIDAPRSCTEGHCGACMCRLESGCVDMASTKALSKRNIERGNILACQSRPKTDEKLRISFDF